MSRLKPLFGPYHITLVQEGYAPETIIRNTWTLTDVEWWVKDRFQSRADHLGLESYEEASDHYSGCVISRYQKGNHVLMIAVVTWEN